jgi:hypothetical protein
MGLWEEMKAGPERRALLEAMTVKDLKSLASAHGVDVKPRAGILGSMEAEGKELIVQRMFDDTRNLPIGVIRDFAGKKRDGDTQQVVFSRSEPEPIATTPTLAPTRSSPQVAFEEVVGYLEQYRFISRYQQETLYEVELAGALRERFGTVMRQFPVPKSQTDTNERPKIIDLDVGGTGIEVKFAIKKQAEWSALEEQVALYKPHYGERLVVLLIGVDANEDHRSHRLREKGVVVVNKA